MSPMQKLLAFFICCWTYTAHAASDISLATRYAPLIYLSQGKYVNLVGTCTDGSGKILYNYKLSDYFPMAVNGLTNFSFSDTRLPRVIPDDVPIGDINMLGTDYATASLLDLSPIYSASRPSHCQLDDPLRLDREYFYVRLKPQPTVYYKVYRDPYRLNPTAVQYWFFYFYNDWFDWYVLGDYVGADHEGDWETVTFFLNEADGVAEAVYSTHYEAIRVKKSQLRFDTGHPKVFAANGGHGSYPFKGETDYAKYGYNDIHNGTGGLLYLAGTAKPAESLPARQYGLKPLNITAEPWLNFKGKWGKDDLSVPGPLLRTDAPTADDSGRAKNRPQNPYKNCADRLGARIGHRNYMSVKPDIMQIGAGPWYWASGYGFYDYATRTDSDCKTVTPCEVALGSTFPKSGTWDDAFCASKSKPGRYAKYFTFDVPAAGKYTIRMTSNGTAAPLFVLHRKATASNYEQVAQSGVISALEAGLVDIELQAGSYRIEATTQVMRAGFGQGFSININLPITRFIKIANDGSELDSSAALGTGPKDWACLKDTYTGLIWEIKTSATTIDKPGLRDHRWRYTWYDPQYLPDAYDVDGYYDYNNDLDGIWAGWINPEEPPYNGTHYKTNQQLCNAKPTYCNTYAYTKAVNAKTLCAASDWRMPSKDELDKAEADIYYYYHDSAWTWFWSASLYNQTNPYTTKGVDAWVIPLYTFQGYYTKPSYKPAVQSVRLVRSGQ